MPSFLHYAWLAASLMWILFALHIFMLPKMAAEFRKLETLHGRFIAVFWQASCLLVPPLAAHGFGQVISAGLAWAGLAG